MKIGPHGIAVLLIGLSRLTKEAVNARRVSLRKKTERRAWRAMREDERVRTVKVGDVVVSRDGVTVSELMHDELPQADAHDEHGIVLIQGDDGGYYVVSPESTEEHEGESVEECEE